MLMLSVKYIVFSCFVSNCVEKHVGIPVIIVGYRHPLRKGYTVGEWLGGGTPTTI